MYREKPQVITNTGNIHSWPATTGIRGSGNHKSHWATCPGSYTVRSTGSTPAHSGRISRSRTRSGLIVYDQPIHSAITAAGIRGHSASSA